MRPRSSEQGGFTLVELVMGLLILGIVSGAVASLLGWSVQVQAREKAAQVAEESAHLALSRGARLVRTAGAYGRPALLTGEPDFLVLCGLPWAGRGVRALVRLDPEGSLVVVPFSFSGSASGCTGEDLAGPVNLVPGSKFSGLSFQYRTPTGYSNQCSSSSTRPCTAVTGVLIQVTPRGARSSSELFVALRNPGGP